MQGPSDVDALAEDVRTLAAELRGFVTTMRESKTNTQTVIHHTSGTTAWHIASVVASFFVTIALAVTWGHFERMMAKMDQDTKAQLDQLRAWNDVNRGKISVLEADKNKH